MTRGELIYFQECNETEGVVRSQKGKYLYGKDDPNPGCGVWTVGKMGLRRSGTDLR